MTKNMFRSVKVVAILVVATIAASSCNKRDPFANLNCPTVLVLAEARFLTQFEPGAGRDITDIEYEGRIASVDYKCTERVGRGYVETKVTVRTEFATGTAAASTTVDFPIFIAVSEGEKKVIEKREQTVKVEFKKGRRIARTATVVKKIRVPLGGEVPPEYHNVVVGFQLTPAQVAYNRTKSNR